MHSLTAAHRTLPFGTKLRVTSKDTGKSILVTVNDRGPYHGRRVLDLSQEAARQLGMIKLGVGQVTIERINRGDALSPRQTEDVPELNEDVQKQMDSLGELIAKLKV
jgi:rare lipoprotein A